ncbi:MAG TPA: efflux transporter outer membrane subunit [Gemmatimonadales bacterium]|nr:efflux transporter outer membrane subunit [Gemmatimonadales bacterium]
MKRLVSALAGAVLLSGCIGRSYQPVVPEGTQVGAPQTADSMRAFFDSLAAARATDTASPGGVAAPGQPLRVDSLSDLGWLDVLRDTVLQRLVNTALHHNRTLQAARAAVREYRAQAGVARSALFPSLTLNGSVARNKVAFGSLAIPAYTAWRATGDVSWEINFWGLGSGLAAANADLASREDAERATVLSLVSDVAGAYLQLLELDQERTITEQTLASEQATLQIARARFSRGLISELDVRQFEAQVAVPAARLARLEQLRAQAEHQLNVLLGEGPASIPRGGSLADAARAIQVPDSIPASLLDRRPDVQAAERAYAAASARVGIADAARLPTFTITGSWGSQSQTLKTAFDSNSRIYQAQLGVSIPIFAGGRYINEGRAARARAEQARAAYQQTALTAMQEAGDALSGVRAARDVAAANETQANALQQALKLAKLRYGTGLASYLDVLDAQRSLYAAQLAASQAELGQLTAAVQLYKAIGGSWPKTAAK